ncbi:MAG: NAD(P)H-dependent oxidoreductase [Lentisphaerota bacterium]
MKLLALLGYPRQNGHTARMTQLFLKGAEAAGAEIQRVDLTTADIRPCRGCYSCWTKTPGQCVQKDAMAPLLEAFLDSDLVLIASPIYAFSVSSYVKHFMERTLTILSPGVEIGSDGIERNRFRYPGRGPKRMAGLLLAGRKTPNIVQPSVDMLTLYAEEMRMKCSGILVRTESCALRFPQAKPLRMKAIITGVERAGAEFVREKRISESLLQDVSCPLLVDLPHFERYSAIFWEHALEKHDECDAAGESAGEDVRILIYEMARYISPSATRDIEARLQFDFSDRGWKFKLSILRGTCTIAEGEMEKPDLLIRCPASLWSAVVRRTLTGSQLMAHPDLHLEGDRDLFRRLPRYFPLPTD